VKWDGSSIRESTRLKSVLLGEILKDSSNSNLPHPTPIFLDLEKVQLSYNDLKRNLRLPKYLDEELAEDIGIQIGDGSVPIVIDKKGTRHYKVACYGNRIEDINYFENKVIPLKQKLFNLILSLKEDKNAGTCFVKVESKGIVSFYTKVIGIKEGKKLEISIPNLILNSPLPIQLACLRGIADTDFSLVFKKDFKGVHRDPYIQLGCSSMILVNQISGILSKINIHSTLILNQKAKIKGRKREYLKHYLNVHG